MIPQIQDGLEGREAAAVAFGPVLWRDIGLACRWHRREAAKPAPSLFVFITRFELMSNGEDLHRILGW